MKKILLTLGVIIGLVFTASAGELGKAFDRIKADSGMRQLTRQQGDSLMRDMQSCIPYENYTTLYSGFESGSRGVTEAGNRIQSAIAGVPESMGLYKVLNDYNSFLLFAEPSGTTGRYEILAVWQLNYFGRTVVMYGEVTASDLQLISMGSLQLNHFGVSFNPMPEAYYQKLMDIAAIQEKLQKDGAALDKAQQQQLIEQYRRDMLRLDPIYGVPYSK